MATQKAIAVVEVGKPVQLIERAIPEPGANEVLVRVSTAGLNPHDALIRNLAAFIGPSNLPAVPATDIIGAITTLGSNVDVTKFHIGDHVMGQGDPSRPDTGGLQEYALLDAAYMARLPGRVSPDQACTLILNVLTAFGALFAGTGLGIPFPLDQEGEGFDYKNARIVIIGGGSACGKFAIQIARWARVGTIVAVAGKSGAEGLKAMGATHVVDRSLSAERVQEAVRSIVGDDLLYVLDCINRRDHTFAVRMLSDSKRGTAALLAGPLQDTVDQSSMGPKKEGYGFARFVARPAMFKELAGRFWELLPGWIEEGVVLPTEFEVIEGFEVGRIDAQIDGWSRGEYPVRVNVHVG